MPIFIYILPYPTSQVLMSFLFSEIYHNFNTFNYHRSTTYNPFTWLTYLCLSRCSLRSDLFFIANVYLVFFIQLSTFLFLKFLSSLQLLTRLFYQISCCVLFHSYNILPTFPRYSNVLYITTYVYFLIFHDNYFLICDLVFRKVLIYPSISLQISTSSVNFCNRSCFSTIPLFPIYISLFLIYFFCPSCRRLTSPAHY